VLTEKQKSFCREYFSNGGNGTQAYLFAYDSKSEVAAANESSLLLKRDDIQEYIKTLNRPLEDKAISEREKKRSILWERIQVCITNNDDAAVARYMDILNKMNAEYININRNIEDKAADIKTLDTSVLEKLARPS
jgi:phage terminase small subunit